MSLLETIGINSVTFAILAGFFTWLGKVQANRIQANEEHNLSKTLEEIKSQLAVQLNKQNTAFNLYFSGQFDIYNKLWSSIVDLEDAVDLLWDGVDRKRFNSFVSAVRKTKTHVRKAAPFIDNEHYALIDNFFKMVDEYKIGKEEILRFDDLSDDEFNSRLDEINHFVDRNRVTRENIHNFSQSVLEDFRGKLRG